MHVGMLWFDNDPHTALKTKIEKAVDYYRQKYGREPNLCLLHPSMMEKDRPEIGKPALPAPVPPWPDRQDRQAQVSTVKGITVRPYRPVLPGHLWIGIEDKN